MTIRVGVTHAHGIALEHMSHPPEGIEYCTLKKRSCLLNNVITPDIMWASYNDEQVDIVEAPIFPVVTTKPLIYTPADAYTLFGFDLFGFRLPRILKGIIVRFLFSRTSNYRLVFKSRAGLKSLDDYPKLVVKKLAEQSSVIYPAVKVANQSPRYTEKRDLNILFAGGDFFCKGGMHVVDVFLKLRQECKNLSLKIYTDPNLKDGPRYLANEYLEKIKSCPDIILSPLVSRNKFLHDALRTCDVFVMPTYRDSYGYILEEAIAQGKPVVSTNIFAIPEILSHGQSGFLIPIRNHPFIRGLKKYRIESIPESFKEFMYRELYSYLKTLIDNSRLRIDMGKRGWSIAKQKFSFEDRNRRMLEIYKELAKGKGPPLH